MRTRAIPERFCGGDSLEEVLHQVYALFPLPLSSIPLEYTEETIYLNPFSHEFKFVLHIVHGDSTVVKVL